MTNNNVINDKKKALLAYKEKILEEIKYYEQSIEEFRSNYKNNSNYEQDCNSSDSEEEFLCTIDTGPTVLQLKQQQEMLKTCLHATEELTGLTVLQSEVNVLVDEPKLDGERPVSEPGVWKEITAECRVDLIPFTITFYMHTPSRKFGQQSYRCLRVVPVKKSHEMELSKSVLHTLKLPSDAVEVIRSYAAGYRSRRTTLSRLANKYGNALFMEPHPEGGFILKCADLLEVSWRLENKWSPVAPFHHRMKFDLEYMDESYIKIITQAHKQLLDPSIQTDERTLLLAKIITTCLEVKGPIEPESDLESKTTDNDKADNKKEREKDIEVMAPPKSLPKKTKRSKNSLANPQKRSMDDGTDGGSSKRMKNDERTDESDVNNVIQNKTDRENDTIDSQKERDAESVVPQKNNAKKIEKSNVGVTSIARHSKIDRVSDKIVNRREKDTDIGAHLKIVPKKGIKSKVDEGTNAKQSKTDRENDKTATQKEKDSEVEAPLQSNPKKTVKSNIEGTSNVKQNKIDKENNKIIGQKEKDGEVRASQKLIAKKDEKNNTGVAKEKDAEATGKSIPKKSVKPNIGDANTAKQSKMDKQKDNQKDKHNKVKVPPKANLKNTEKNTGIVNDARQNKTDKESDKIANQKERDNEVVPPMKNVTKIPKKISTNIANPAQKRSLDEGVAAKRMKNHDLVKVGSKNNVGVANDTRKTKISDVPAHGGKKIETSEVIERNKSPKDSINVNTKQTNIKKPNSKENLVKTNIINKNTNVANAKKVTDQINSNTQIKNVNKPIITGDKENFNNKTEKKNKISNSNVKESGDTNLKKNKVAIVKNGVIPTEKIKIQKSTVVNEVNKIRDNNFKSNTKIGTNLKPKNVIKK